MIAEIESAWRDTLLTCPECGGLMVSDGKFRPQCADCLVLATDAQIYKTLITAMSKFDTPPALAVEAKRRGWHLRHAVYTYPDGTVEEAWEYTDDPVDGPWWKWRE